MIKSLHIQNFQSHEKSKLEFDPGVNVIVGPTDSGKTAIIRALRWVAWNRPTGDSIRSNWGGTSSVEIKTETFDIVRNKDKADTYTLYQAGEAIQFKAFGTSVPEEIVRLLNIHEVNLQSQLDSPFLLSESPGAVAQHFNKVAKLDKIDTGLQNVQSGIRELTSDIKYKEQEITGFKEELKEYDYLEKAEIELEVLEDMAMRMTNLVVRQSKLEKLISAIKDTEADIEEESSILKYEIDVNTILDFIKTSDEEKITRDKLIDIISEIQKTKEKIQQYSVVFKYENTVNSVLKLYEERDLVEGERKQLFKALQNVINSKRTLKKQEEERAAFQAKFERAFPDLCPLCGKPK
jgi:exonuclease SbcC